MSRVVVYDRHWATGGGGEKYAAGLGAVLSETHEVTLLAHEPIDLAWLGERLDLDLTGVDVRVVEETEPLHEATAGYDLLLNASYRSHGRNGARHGVYVVHFPDRPGGDLRPWQRAARGALAPRHDPVAVVRGFHEPDVIRWQEVRWTDGEGVLAVDVPPGERRRLRVHLGRFLPDGRPRPVEVVVDDRVVAGTELQPVRSRLDVVVPETVEVPLVGGDEPVEVRIRSAAGVAADALGNGDRRRLGVPVVGAALDGDPRGPLARFASLAVGERRPLAWLDSYGTVVSNSAFTRRWVRTWWGRESAVLFPPVGLRRPGGEKDRMILAVGRFIAPGRGHAKQQLELVEGFRRLLGLGLADGWTLQLAGGCSDDDRPYLDRVRAAAVGLPVAFHVDVTGAELDELYRRASLFWHATGLGEDLEADPVRAEHFGITTAEAMSAGAVPVVVAAGGQPEVVEDGVSGFTFTDLDQLVALTARLVEDDELRRTMAEAAVARSHHFGMEAFSDRLHAVVDPLLEDR